MKYWILRWMYRSLYLLAEAGIEEGSDIVYGFARKYPAPDQVPNEELHDAIQRLAEGIKVAS